VKGKGGTVLYWHLKGKGDCPFSGSKSNFRLRLPLKRRKNHILLTCCRQEVNEVPEKKKGVPFVETAVE